MKSYGSSLPLAALLAASVNAQTNVVVNNPADPLVTTVYIPVCPTATSITTTLGNTFTACPGPYCTGGGPPYLTDLPGGGPPVPTGNEVASWTVVGADGDPTVYGVYQTVYGQVCSSGMEPATYTVTQSCGCHASELATALPSGFTTTTAECTACEAAGGPKTVTITTPCSTGPYASVTPAVGTYTDTAAIAGITTPAAPVASAASASEAAASAMAGSAGAAAGSGSGAGASGAVAPGAGQSGVQPEAVPTGAAMSMGMGSNNTISPAITGPGGSSNGPSNTNAAPVAQYSTGSADTIRFAASTLFAGIIGCFAFLL